MKKPPKVCVHLPPFPTGVERPDMNRPGWVAMYCEKCGRFIGCREIVVQKPKR